MTARQGSGGEWGGEEEEKNKHGRRRRGCKCSPRLEERTNGRRDGDGASERAGPRRGGNPLSAKLCSAGMYSRLFTHVTRLAAAQRAVCLGAEGRRTWWRGVMRGIRWMWRGGDEHETRQAIGGHFFPRRSNSARALTGAGRYVDGAALLGVLHFCFCFFVTNVSDFAIAFILHALIQLEKNSDRKKKKSPNT